MANLKEYHRVLLWTLHALEGEATIGDVAKYSGLTVNGISQMLGANLDAYIEVTRSSAGRRYDTLRLVADISDVRRPPINVQGLSRLKAEQLAKEHGIGLNAKAHNLLRQMMEMLYKKPDLGSPLVPGWTGLKTFEIEFLERRARQLVAEHPLQD